MTTQEQRIEFAEEMGIPIIEELGILYKDGQRSFGNSAEYTAQKCANYQRQGLGCELIKRKTCGDFDPFTNANDAEAIIEHMRGKGWGYTLSASDNPDDKDQTCEFWWISDEDGHESEYISLTGTGQNMRQAICSAFAAYIQSKRPCA